MSRPARFAITTTPSQHGCRAARDQRHRISLFTTNEVVVSNQDLAGAVSGGGYKFTPAPPQPTKIYTVTVDSQIESMGFLQTGYSGSLAPMTVRYPDGTPVDCNDSANVLCLSQNNGLLQYVQVNINGRTGDYTAQVNVGATGEATFSFNALAASPIQPAALGKRTLSLNSQTLRVDFGRPSENGVLAGWLADRQPAHVSAMTSACTTTAPTAMICLATASSARTRLRRRAAAWPISGCAARWTARRSRAATRPLSTSSPSMCCPKRPTCRASSARR